jgi:hypothetical protein
MMAQCWRRSRRCTLPGLAMIVFAALCAPAGSFEMMLTTEEVGRLLQVVEKQGTRVHIPRAEVSVLQLQTVQTSPDVKQVAFLDGEGIKHGFAPLSDNSGYFLFRKEASAGHTVFYVDSKLHLVRAARSFVNQQLLALPEEEAKKQLGEEFESWSRVLSPNGPAMSSPLHLPATGAAMH